ncbi:MAG: polysaccharide biosynthesis protein [Myxococcales bacterium]|nr:polysaccharide biosynthesis protein [Myxococcales bacterium]
MTRDTAKSLLDLTVVTLAVTAAYIVRFERIPDGELGVQMLVLTLALPLARLLAGRVSGTHRSSWRLFGLSEALVLARAVAVVSGLLLLSRGLMPALVPSVHPIPFGVIALEGCLSLVGLLGLRVGTRMLDEHRARRSVPMSRIGGPRRALLVGAGRAGRMAVRELRARPDAGFSPVGFLDDDPARVGQIIEGVPVLGTTEDAARIALETSAEMLVLTIPSATHAQTRAVVERCRPSELPIQTVPGLYELLGGKVGITTIRPLKIEDLLGREVVAFDETAVTRVRRAFAGRRVLVTGAGGSIGSELCRQIAELDPELLILVDNHETHLFDIEQALIGQLGERLIPCLVDVQQATDVAMVFAEHRPQLVFHAAAYKHVPMMQLHPTKAVSNNVRGTRLVAEAARRFGTERFVLVSTDKAVNPTSVMGATKRAAEMQVLSMEGPTRFSAVRFGNVLGSAGSVLHTFARQIEAGGPVTLTHPEITRFFMTIPEAVRLVLQASAVGEGGELFVLDMGEPVRIVELARQMIRLAGFDSDEIPIEVVGLRPGEKLHEELLGPGEDARPSPVPSVWVSPSAPPPVDDLQEWLARLEEAADAHDADGVLQCLAEGTGFPAPLPRDCTDPGGRIDGADALTSSRSAATP